MTENRLYNSIIDIKDDVIEYWLHLADMPDGEYCRYRLDWFDVLIYNVLYFMTFMLFYIVVNYLSCIIDLRIPLIIIYALVYSIVIGFFVSAKVVEFIRFVKFLYKKVIKGNE